MADFPTYAELFRVARDEMLSKNSKLTAEIIERDGSDANIQTSGMASAAEEVIGQLAAAEAALFLSSAKKKDLDRLVFDRYGITRKVASPAIGSVAFSTVTANPSAFSIPAGTPLSTPDGRRFVTMASVTFPAASVGPIMVAVRSVLAGLSQQAAAGTITSISGAITGAPSDLSVTNPLATAGATNEELDDELRDRARRFFVTARRGTLDAIEAVALEVAGVVKATAVEQLDAMGRPARAVELIVADQYTDLLVSYSPTPATYQTQSQVLAQTVYLALEDTRAAGIYVNVRVASVVLQGVQLALRFQAGVDVDTVALKARSAVVNTINSLSPGKPLLLADIYTALRKVRGLTVTDTEVVSPQGDVLPETLQVLRSNLGLVVASSLSPDQALQDTSNPDAV